MADLHGPRRCRRPLCCRHGESSPRRVGPGRVDCELVSVRSGRIVATGPRRCARRCVNGRRGPTHSGFEGNDSPSDPRVHVSSTLAISVTVSPVATQTRIHSGIQSGHGPGIWSHFHSHGHERANPDIIGWRTGSDVRPRRGFVDSSDLHGLDTVHERNAGKRMADRGVGEVEWPPAPAHPSGSWGRRGRSPCLLPERFAGRRLAGPAYSVAANQWWWLRRRGRAG